MSNRQRNDSQRSDGGSVEQIQQGGLRRRLLWSHLFIASIGVGLMIVGLGTTLWLRSDVQRLANVRGPAMRNSTLALSGIQHSVAGLRGWVALGDPKMKADWETAWANEIRPSLTRLQSILSRENDPNSKVRIEEVLEILDRLERSQRQVSEVAQTRQNEPARLIMAQHVRPVALTIVDEITEMIEEEKLFESGADRKTLLGWMADFRGNFTFSQGLLGDFLEKRHSTIEVRFREKIKIASQRINAIGSHKNLLSAQQHQRLTSIQTHLRTYQLFADQAIAVHKSDNWNVARHLMSTQAVPQAQQAIELLDAISEDQAMLMQNNAALVTKISNLVSWLSLGLIIVTAGLAAIISAYNARRITQPIETLVRATRDLAAGRLREDIPVTSQDELALLTTAFNSMRADIVQSEARLQAQLLEEQLLHQAIAGNEVRLSAMLASSRDPMITIDCRGIVQSASDSVKTVIGWNPDELIGKNINVLMPEPYHSEHDEYLSNYLRTGKSIIFDNPLELVTVHKDGSKIPCEVTVSRVDIPNQLEPLFLGVIRDISKRNAAETKLRRFRAALDCSADAVLLVDRATMRFIDMNETACQSIGYSRDELLDMGPQDIKPYISEQELAEKFDDVIVAKHKVGIIETLHARKDGTLFPAEVFLRALETEQGTILIEIARDITERKENEQRIQEHTQKTERLNLDLEVSKAHLERTVQQLDEINEELVRKNTELDEFTYVASHDLQEPVRKLVSFSTLLKKDAGEALPERAEKDLDFITDAAHRMQTLVRDLLALSRAGRSAMKHERVSLTECIDRAVDALAVRMEETGAEIVRDELPEIDGDRTMLTQLYQNLIGNALKFIAADQPQVHLTAELEEGRWVLGVRDNGIGIDPAYAEQIFSPFKRLHGRGEYEGTGIGLSICRKTAERHGGNIWVESLPGEGAHFKFSIPINTESEECKLETTTENQPSFS